ncbi:MAG: DUF4397 domain-containing protein [Candidatus Kapabacteria bacterium]|nr:DUF4397 domain-containing protein [Candidatus Kapabacteria bacterium]MDW8011888.1 hypothetical protein [Bacteroidota bacterium]
MLQRIGWIGIATSVAIVSAYAQIASFSVLHATADPELERVDVYYDGDWLQLGLPFRQLSFRREVLAGPGLSYRISVLPEGSTGASNAVATITLAPQPERDYILVFLGLRVPQRFAPNPDGLSTAARLLIQEVPIMSDTDRVWLAFTHAATDVPRLRILRGNGQPLYTGSASYGTIVQGLLPADTLTVELVSSDGSPIARFRGDLRPFEGSSGLLVLSGFAQPARNQNGASLGLHAVFLDGTIIEFQRLDAANPTAQVQIIHASPDPQLRLVDVYLNGTRVDDFGFRSTTPVMELPAERPLTIGLAPSNSRDVRDTLRSFTVILPSGVQIGAVVCGVLSPQNFAPNPEGRPTDLTIVTFPLQLQSSPGTVALSAVHAVTDAPAVTLRVGGQTIAEGLSFASTAPYRELPASADTLRGLPSEYVLNLSPHNGRAAVLVVTGFANPAANGNGPDLQPILVLPDGTVIPLTPPASVPSSPNLSPTVRYSEGHLWLSLPQEGITTASVELFSPTGERVAEWMLPQLGARWHALPLGSSLARGVYLCRIASPALARVWHSTVLVY